MDDMVIIPKSELAALMRTIVSEEIDKTKGKKAPQPTIKGIHGLAGALKCSVAKAQKLKNSGIIRYFQDGKLVLFDYDQVIDDLKGQNINKRGRKVKS